MKIALSLFDGMSCGQLALQRAGVSVDYYLASEVDKAAITVATRNWPDMVHLGDVRELDGTTMVSPFILMGGSPCQSFSFAGKRNGMSTEQGEEVTTLERYLELKSEGFAFSGQSYLFWEYVRILQETRPKYFFLENVVMVQKWARVISDTLGVEPVMINSALVSAQNRKRLYWTNIPGVGQPEDKGILLKDVVFSDAVNPTVGLHNLHGGFGEKEHRTFTEKSPTIRTASGGGHIPSLLLTEKALEYMNRQVSGGRTHWDFSHHSDVRSGKSQTVVANFFKGVPYNVLKDWKCIRKFHPIECERLQTVPENYTDGVSDTQRYRMLGNGWTVDVIAHILRHIPEAEK